MNVPTTSIHFDGVRQARIRQMLIDHNAGAFVAWRPDELVLLTGYYPQWGASFCLYPAVAQPILFNPVLEPTDFSFPGIDVRTYSWGKSADPWADLLGQMTDALRERGLTDAPVSYVPAVSRSATGINSAEGQPVEPEMIARLGTTSPAGWRDTTSAFLEQYLLKTPLEVERIRLAHQAAAAGVRAFYAGLQANASEAEVASQVEAAVQNQMAVDPAVYFARAWAFIQSGPNSVYGGTYSRTTGRRMQPGELVMIEMAVCVNGYWADITRTGVVSSEPPSKQHREIADAVAAAQFSAVAAVRAGTPARAVDKVARDYIRARGFGRFYEHHLGHHVGFRYHDPGPVLAPDSTFTLQPGMIVTIEPGIYGEELGAGCRIEDNVLVTENGSEVLSDSPKSLDGS